MEANISEIVKNWTMAIAIIVGGLWAVWKWGFGEWVRRKREVPSLECQMIPTVNDIEGGKVWVTINAEFRNTGSTEIGLSTTETAVSVFPLESTGELGPLELADLGEPTFTRNPLDNFASSSIEPHTTRSYPAHFILEPETVYGFRLDVYQSAKPLFGWHADLVFKPRTLIAHSDKSTGAA